MMYILIDTNIFFDNWFLKSPQFSLLANFLNNTKSILLIPSVICEEVDHKYKSEVSEFLVQASTIQRKYKKYGISIQINAETTAIEDFDFQKILSLKFDFVEIIQYNGISHETLVHKALNGKRPFRDKEKGYRDALIWLSAILHLKQRNDSHKVAFITNNVSDFFEIKKEEIFLHKDLLEDLIQYDVKNDFLLYTSLKNFIDANIEPVIHNFNHEEFIEKYGDLLESSASDYAIDYLNNLPIQSCRELLEEANYPSICTKQIERMYFDDFQGVEDPEVLNFKKASENTIYIEYTFNLLSVEIRSTVLTNDYFSNKTAFDKIFMNIETNGNETYICDYPRIYYDATIIFNTKNEEIETFSIDSVRIRRY